MKFTMLPSLPKVCICIPTYNAANTIAETLGSLLNQTYRNLSIQIIDNASTDNTLSIVRNIKDLRIKIIEHSENIGGEGNFNRCINLANGDYTAIFHADDVYEPDMIEKQVLFFKNNTQVGAVFTEAMLINELSIPIKLCKVPSSFKTVDNCYTFEQIFKGILKHSNFLFCPSAMVKTEIYQKEILCWRSELYNTSSDLDVWLRISQNHLIGIIPFPLMNYRISHLQGSERIRRNIQQADFFKVINCYLQNPDINQKISMRDLRYYRCLEVRDQVMRAVNFLLRDDILSAKLLCDNVFFLKIIKQKIINKRTLLTFILGVIIRIVILTKQEEFGKKLFKILLGAFHK